MKTRSRDKRFKRRGTAAVETAVVAPLVLMAMLGMMEVGYSFMLRQTVVYASREGVRAGALPGGTMDDINTAVDACMGAAGLQRAVEAQGDPGEPLIGDGSSGYTVTSNMDQLGPTDTQLWVKVSMPFNRDGFTGALMGGGAFNIEATTEMRREGVDAN